jgi:hypothetical protein
VKIRDRAKLNRHRPLQFRHSHLAIDRWSVFGELGHHEREQRCEPRGRAQLAHSKPSLALASVVATSDG